MKKFFNDRKSLLIIGMGLIVAGMIHWPIPYAEMDMLGKPFVLKMSISALLIGATGVLLIKKTPLSASLFTTLGYFLAVMLRVIFDATFIDSTSHNLWPFEVIIVILIAFPASLIGAVITHLLIRSLSKE